MKKISSVLTKSLPPSLFIFKTIVDPFVGRESLFKVCTGRIQIGMSLLNVNKNEVEKVNKLYIKRGKELIEVDELCAGDIGCMTSFLILQQMILYVH